MNLMCDVCGVKFCTPSNLKKHQKNFHNICDIENKKTSYHLCAISECKYENSPIELRKHYEKDHKLQLNEESLYFKDENSFKEWKCQMEKETVCKYILLCGEKQGIKRYVCHRSGNFKSKGNNIRHIKTQGSKKIGAYCPAQIIVFKNFKNGIEVKHLNIHIGHENELCHVTLSPNTKQKIATKLLNGVPREAIIDDVRNSVTSDKLERIHLLTTKDIYNITKEHIHHEIQKQLMKQNHSSVCDGASNTVNLQSSIAPVSDDGFNCVNEAILADFKTTQDSKEIDQLLVEAKSYCKDPATRQFFKREIQKIISRLKCKDSKTFSPSKCTKTAVKSKKRGNPKDGKLTLTSQKPLFSTKKKIQQTSTLKNSAPSTSLKEDISNILILP